MITIHLEQFDIISRIVRTMSDYNFSLIEAQNEHEIIDSPRKTRSYVRIFGILLAFVVVLVIFSIIIFKLSNESAFDSKNPGEPLYLTKYIESGDIKKVESEKLYIYFF